MRQSPTDQLGNAGESAAVVFFEDLGWGPLQTHKHDLGTDLFVQVRRDDLTDLGILIGVQVKTGDSFFDEPTQVGGRSGWLFREDDHRHENYWANHHIPHILIVQDQKRQRRFWVRLDRDTIESTGKGIRVFFPEDQPLSKGAAATWIEIAAEARKLQSFEGSRWTFNITQLPESEWPRYALLASRITAPHPNQGFSAEINWAEAAALCIQAEPQRWEYFAQHQENVPTPAEALISEDPGWRFAAAIYGWLLHGKTSELETLDTTQMPKALRIAHAICVSTILTGREQWADAITILRTEADPEDLSIDQAWLTIHIGWALFDNGQISEARTSFEESLAMHAAFPTSLTNSAIRSAGILALFDLATLHSGDLASAAQALDSTLSWWQNQQIGSALNRFLHRSYAKWAHDPSITLGSGDPTHNDLLSAELSARLTGNRRSSRYATCLRAMANLALPNGDHAKTENQLESLRAAGCREEISLALCQLRNEGPLAPVGVYMAQVRVARTTPMSIWADLESLKIAGAYLPRPAATDWLVFLLQAFDRPTEFAQRFNSRFVPEQQILDAIDGLKLHFEETQEHELLRISLSLPEDSVHSLETPLRQILHALHPTVLAAHSHEIDSRIQALPSSSWLQHVFIDLLADRNTEARSVLGERIKTHPLEAIPDGFHIDSLAPEEATAIIRECACRIEEYRRQTTGAAVEGPNPYSIVASVALFGPKSTRLEAWNAVVEGVTARDVLHDRKTDAVQLLASNAGAIPKNHREALLQSAGELRAVQPSRMSEFYATGFGGPGPAFAELYLELFPEGDDWQGTLTSLLTGTPSERCAGIGVLTRRPGHELLLLALVQDADVNVARSATRGVARRAAEDSAVARMALPHLLALVESAGEQAAGNIGRGILAASKRVAEISPLVTALQSHTSLQIRSLARELDNMNHVDEEVCEEAP